MKRMRKIGFAEQASSLMNRNWESIPDSHAAQLLILVQFAAEQTLIKTAFSNQSAPVIGVTATLADRSEIIRVWIALSEQEAIGFAIELSDDEGRTWSDPLKKLGS